MQSTKTNTASSMSEQRTLFVGNFKPTWKKAKLEELFSNFGLLTSVEMFTSVSNKPYAILKYNFSEDAAEVVKELNGAKFGGRRITVKFDEPYVKVKYPKRKLTEECFSDSHSTVCDSEASFMEEIEPEP